MNQAILMGRLTRDCEIRYSAGEKPVAVVNFILAVNRRYKREGEPDADFINCVAFGKTGEFINKYFKKGDMIAVSGEIRVDKYTDKDGNKKTAAKIYVNSAFFCGGNNTGGNTKNETSEEAGYSVENVTDDDELPF